MVTRRALATALLTFAASFASLAGCSNVLGLKDLELDPESEADGGGDGGSNETSTGDGGVDAPLTDGTQTDTNANDGTTGDALLTDGTTTDTSTDTTTADTATDTFTPDTSVGCEAGQTTCNSACVDTSSNPLHCGGCNHDCLGGACTGSACQPVRLAFSQSSPWDLAVDGTSLYFTNAGNGTVMKCATSGCGSAPTTLAMSQISPERITFDATYVYWTDYGDGSPNGAVRRVLKNATGLQTLASSQAQAEGIAVDASFVYWGVRTTPGAVRNVPLGGGSTTSTIVHAGTSSVVYDGTSIFFADTTSTLTRCTPAAGACSSSTTLYTGAAGIFGLGVDSTRVYFATLASNGTVYSATKSNGSNLQTLAGAQPWPVRLATDGVDVVWANLGPSQGGSADGSVMRCAVGGCAGNPSTIASSQTNPHAVAIDTKAIYWANATEVWKVAR